MLRLRVSDLDQWRRFVRPEHEWEDTSVDDFIAYMRREGPETDDMRCGKAFHAILEDAADGLTADVLERDGFEFEFVGDFPLERPETREESIERVYRTPAGDVLLRGRVDGVDRGAIIDYKLTSGQFDAERLAGSYQWKSYLDMLGARRFRYIVFQGRRNDRLMRIFDMHRLDLYGYPPQMHDEVTRVVGELAEFVTAHVPEMAS